MPHHYQRVTSEPSTKWRTPDDGVRPSTEGRVGVNPRAEQNGIRVCVCVCVCQVKSSDFTQEYCNWPPVLDCSVYGHGQPHHTLQRYSAHTHNTHTHILTTAHTSLHTHAHTHTPHTTYTDTHPHLRTHPHSQYTHMCPQKHLNRNDHQCRRRESRERKLA